MLMCFPAAAVLLFGSLHAALMGVAPPTNVELNCHNMSNVLTWTYEQLSPDLRFKITIGVTGKNSYPKEIWVNSSARQADVSFLSDYNNAYLLHIFAVNGQNESVRAPPDGIIFTYFWDNPLGRKCNLDFPSVSISAHDDTLLLRFEHPWVVYLQKLPSSPNTENGRKKSPKPLIFKYDVVIISQGEEHHSFYCEKSVCEERLSVDPAQKKHCLKMKGELEKISVQAKQDYCLSPEAPPPNYVLYITAGILITLAVVVVLVLVMLYRKWTAPNAALPNSVMFPWKLKHVFAETVQERIFVPEEPSSPTPLLPEEETESTTFAPPSTEPELRMAIGLLREDEGVSDHVEGGIDEEAGYTQGKDLDRDEVLYFKDDTGYEKRPVLD
ncbi:interferon gamma receptor 1-like [Anoplopoma fimbria]|uniref:interferon gamma receptor 1-like n=1 Tax=Anoplopoma fimbria TaxID=229290 RepID=UPI0023EC14B0|nr:interferon gamma receptor 1-like [Anoplopoma fimbria]